jgi:hypothetical protein
VKADWTKSKLLAFGLIRSAPSVPTVAQTTHVESGRGNPRERLRADQRVEANAALVLPTANAWTAFFPP